MMFDDDDDMLFLFVHNLVIHCIALFSRVVGIRKSSLDVKHAPSVFSS